MTSEAFRALGCYFERGFEREAGFDEFAFFEEAADERDAMGDSAGWGEFWQGVLGVGGPVAAGFCDFYEAGAAFEQLTLSHGVDQLKAQVPDAWPNCFRQARFLSAVDFVQTDRFRRRVAEEMARIFRQVDLLLVPSLRDEILVITNCTGHPSLTFRAGFIEVSEARSDWAPDPKHPLLKFSPPRRVPHGVTLIGQLFDEGTIARVGIAMETHFGVAAQRPTGF